MKSVESQRLDFAKQIAATKQQIATAEREKKRVGNLLAAGAANQKQLDDWDAQVKLLERQLAAQKSSLQNSTNSLTEQGNCGDLFLCGSFCIGGVGARTCHFQLLGHHAAVDVCNVVLPVGADTDERAVHSH